MNICCCKVWWMWSFCCDHPFRLLNCILDFCFVIMQDEVMGVWLFSWRAVLRWRNCLAIHLSGKGHYWHQHIHSCSLCPLKRKSLLCKRCCLPFFGLAAPFFELGTLATGKKQHSFGVVEVKWSQSVTFTWDYLVLFVGNRYEVSHSKNFH